MVGTDLIDSCVFQRLACLRVQLHLRLPAGMQQMAHRNNLPMQLTVSQTKTARELREASQQGYQLANIFTIFHIALIIMGTPTTLPRHPAT